MFERIYLSLQQHFILIFEHYLKIFYTTLGDLFGICLDIIYLL